MSHGAVYDTRVVIMANTTPSPHPGHHCLERCLMLQIVELITQCHNKGLVQLINLILDRYFLE